MKKLTIFGFLLLQLLIACNNNDADKNAETPTSENDVDAARNFIRASLNGKMDEAKSMLLKDSASQQYFDSYEQFYKTRMDPEDKRGYRESSINIRSVRQVNDSVSVINYSNSFKKKDDSLKVVRVNGEWLVDFKYSFSPSTADSTK